jgi:hypothetical protein
MKKFTFIKDMKKSSMAYLKEKPREEHGIPLNLCEQFTENGSKNARLKDNNLPQKWKQL